MKIHTRKELEKQIRKNYERAHITETVSMAQVSTRWRWKDDRSNGKDETTCKETTSKKSSNTSFDTKYNWKI